MAQVKLFPEAQAQLDELTETIRIRVREVLVRLRKYPAVSGAKPLRRELAGQFRMRTGDYRVQFYCNRQDSTVFVTKIGHRDGFYD